MTIAHDSGFVLNPSGISHVIESGVLQQVSLTLHEEVTFDKSMVTSSHWKAYPLLTLAESPELNIVLVNNKLGGKWNSAGEPVANPIAASITGAFLDATGKIARKLPLKPANGLAARKA
jgi:CO/xanthine dehydrogenase Mo-binding subunit